MTRNTLWAPSIAAMLILISGTADAAFIFEISNSILGRNPPDTRGNTFATTAGTLAAPPTLPTMEYTVSDLDLTTSGAGSDETIVFDIVFTQTGGTGIAFNPFGNIFVTGGSVNNQVQGGSETITATIVVDEVSSTYDGPLEIGFTSFRPGGGQVGSTGVWNVGLDSGVLTGLTNVMPITFAPSSFITLDPNSGTNINFEQFVIQVTVIPEPAAISLLGLIGFSVVGLRRR